MADGVHDADYHITRTFPSVGFFCHAAVRIRRAVIVVWKCQGHASLPLSSQPAPLVCRLVQHLAPAVPPAAQAMAALQTIDLTAVFTASSFKKKAVATNVAQQARDSAASSKKVKSFVFFEVEILDAKNKEQLCFLDKVRA